MSELLCIGVSHKTAPVEVRERLALTEARAAEFLRGLDGDAEIQEAVALSTCNRTELYLVVSDLVEADSTVLGMLARQAGIRPTALSGAIYSHHNCDAARHLYRVTAGLESMIVGEAEIQGQVKRAYEAAVALGSVGPFSHRLFGAALATGKRVRTETVIGERQLSLSSVAVSLARELLGDLAGKQVVIVGTGETSELTARTLADSGGHTVFVAGRRRARAISMARRYGGESLSFDELPQALERADVVVTATASPHLLIEAEELAEVLGVRRGRPMLIIDLAVPRDVEAACGDLPEVSLYDIDGLQAAIDRNRRVRQGEARKAEGIVEQEIGKFAGWLGSLEVLPTLAALRARSTEIALGVVRDNDGKWETASPRDRERVEAIARAVANRILHHPTARIKELRDDRVHARMALLRDLFDLSVEDAADLSDATPVGAGAAAAEAEGVAATAAGEADGEGTVADIRSARRRRA